MLIIGSNDALPPLTSRAVMAALAAVPSMTTATMAKVGNTQGQKSCRGCEMATVLLHCVPLWEEGGGGVGGGG